MKKQTFIILTIILNLMVFAALGVAQDAYFEQQIKSTKPVAKTAPNTTMTEIGGAAPANDMLENAETITLNNNSIALLRGNVDATKEQNEPNHGENPGGKSVWFSFTPTQTQVVRIETTHPVTNFDTTLGVYKGNNFYNGFTRVAYSDDCATTNGCGFSSVVDLKLEAGTTYRIAVDGYNDGAATAAGVFVLTLTASNSPVSYDNFANAYDLGTNLAGSVAGTTYLATGEQNEPAAYNSTLGGKSVWYRFKSVNRRAMTFAVSSDFGTEVAVYVSPVANPTFAQLSKLDYNTNGNANNRTQFAVNFPAGQFGYYFIQIDFNDYDPSQAANGNYQLKFYQTKLNYTTQFHDNVPFSSPTLFRPSDSVWYSLRYIFNHSEPQYMKFGYSTDTPVPADFDGDGLTNYAVARNQNGFKYWYILSQDSSTAYTYIPWGLSTDEAVTGDFDRDGFADPTVLRKVNGQLVWYARKSSDGGMRAFVFGLNGDRPAIGDFDGDGATEVAVVRNTGGNLVWWILNSGGTGVPYNQTVSQQFGLATDIPVAADYDGDGQTDIAVWRPSTGVWYILRSKNGELQTTQYGTTGDQPQPADFDADGKAELAVYRPTTGEWYYWSSYINIQYHINWGKPGDIPVASMTRFSLPEPNE